MLPNAYNLWRIYFLSTWTCLIWIFHRKANGRDRHWHLCLVNLLEGQSITRKYWGLQTSARSASATFHDGFILNWFVSIRANRWKWQQKHTYHIHPHIIHTHTHHTYTYTPYHIHILHTYTTTHTIYIHTTHAYTDHTHTHIHTITHTYTPHTLHIHTYYTHIQITHTLFLKYVHWAKCSWFISLGIMVYPCLYMH